MELRTAETDIIEIQTLYESVRRGISLDIELPTLKKVQNDSTNSSQETEEQMMPTSAELERISFGEALNRLECVRNKLDKLSQLMDRFRKRLNEADPVTGKPRYGERTMNKVKGLLFSYEDLKLATAVVFGDTNSGLSGNMQESGLQQGSVFDQLRLRVEQEKTNLAHLVKQEQEKLEREEAAKMAEKIRKEEEQRLLEEAQRLEHERHTEALARQAEEARLSLLRAQREEESRDREWVASIATGTDGVRKQLNILIDSTKDDPLAQTVAINALQKLFSQIVARPEEPNFRRIRRDHPVFNQDIGRHPGGKEILIAAGFTLGSIDDVPSYISKEPDIESDMDRWSEWFDLLKSTLDLVEQQLMK